MNIIARNALSPWAGGFQHKGMTFRPAALHRPMTPIRMGQASGAVTQAVRDQTLTLLNDAFQKGAAIDSWRSENPDWQLAMQKDGDEVARLATVSAPLLATAQKVQKTLQGTDPASWIVSQQEITDSTTWANNINAMYGLIAKHSTTLRPVSGTTPGTTPGATPGTTGAAAKTDYTIPIAIGAGALILGLIFWKTRSAD